MVKITAREVLAVANVDALRPNISEYLLQAISEFRFDFLIGTGAGARTATFDIPKFSFVGTTSKPWLVDARVRRWCIPIQFSPYTQDEVAEIVKRIAQTKDLCLDDEAASQVAMQSNLKLGEADVFLQKVRNHFSFNRADRIDRALVLRLGEYFGTCDPYPVSLAFADEVRSMDGIEFEHWVADLFTRAGFQVQVTKASGDHGVDLFASRAGCLIAVQCKRWEGPIGEPVVRDLYGSMTSAKAEAGCIVTTGFFTAQAQQFAAGKRVYLIPLDVLLTVAKSPLALNQILECA